MSLPNHLVLVGLMGAGKSTVGRLLANSLDAQFVDTDSLFESETHGTIASFFTEHGEEEFRRIEIELLQSQLDRSDRTVIATGGGIVTTEAGRSLLADVSPVIFLDVSPEVAARRVGDAKTRPLLAGDPLGRLQELAHERRAAYEGIADLVVSVDDRSPGAVVGAILSFMDVES